MDRTGSRTSHSATHLPALGLALILMVAGTANPRLLADAKGHADHVLLLFVFWAMTAGFVRGVGFVPRNVAIRWILSGWACGLALFVAIVLRALR